MSSVTGSQNLYGFMAVWGEHFTQKVIKWIWPFISSLIKFDDINLIYAVVCVSVHVTWQ
jgi:hypothetical protein